MLDTFLFVSLGVIQFAIVLWGGWIAFQSMPPGVRKPVHWWLFPILAVIGLGLTIWVGKSNYDSQKDAKRYQDELLGRLKTAGEDLSKEKGDLEGARLDLKFMSGQLSGLQITVAAFGKSDQGRNDQTLKALATAIQNVASNREVARIAATPSNKELQDRAIAVANKMRELEQQYETDSRIAGDAHQRSFQGKNREQLQAYVKPPESRTEEEAFENRMSQITSDAQRRYRMEMFGEASYLWSEILKRLPPRPRGRYDYMFENGNNFGAFPLLPAANDLESIAKQLPVATISKPLRVAK